MVLTDANIITSYKCQIRGNHSILNAYLYSTCPSHRGCITLHHPFMVQQLFDRNSFLRIYLQREGIRTPEEDIVHGDTQNDCNSQIQRMKVCNVQQIVTSNKPTCNNWLKILALPAN